MARRLTTFSRFLITLLIVVLIVLGLRYLYNSGTFDGMLPDEQRSGTETTTSTGTDNGKKTGGLFNRGGSSDDVIKVGVVTWGGYAGGEYFNEGFSANKNSRFYKDYGFQVEFKVLDDFDASRNAFKADEVNLLWSTIDAFPTEVEGLSDYEPQVVFQSDWSRGGDAIVVRRGIRNVADLRGKNIAVAPMTPSHTFLIWLLDAGGLTAKDVNIKEMPSAIDAADAFKANQVDAAVVWSPDDADCVSKVPGAKILENTKNASHIIADVFLAKKSYIEANREKLKQLYNGWMKGAAEINSSDANKRKAAKILAEGLGQPEDFCYDAINNVRLTTHGDNLDFFGLNPSYKGVTGEDLYNKMKVTYNKLGYAPANVRSWRLVGRKDIVQGSGMSAAGAQASEAKKVFTKATEADRTKEAISTKQVSINFRTGEFRLDENAKYIIDSEFTPIAKAFSNSRIRIEGNTDNTGSRNSNIALSLKRANAVADYLAGAHSMDKNRFIIIGNGPDKPISNNNTNDGRAKNRRTDFELVGE